MFHAGHNITHLLTINKLCRSGDMVDVRPHRKLHNQMSLQKKTNMKVDCRSELVSCTVLSFALKDLFHKKFNKHSFCCHTTTSSSSFSTVHSSGETSLILAVSSHFFCSTQVCTLRLAMLPSQLTLNGLRVST